MNTNNSIGNNLTRATLSLAVVSLTLLVNSAGAQEKGGEHMLKLQQLNSVQVIESVKPGDTILMSCPKCKDTWVTVVTNGSKPSVAGDKLTQTIHQCPGCETKIVSEEVGKTAKEVIKHVCKSCGSEDAQCCVMKKGTKIPTKGMDMK